VVEMGLLESDGGMLPLGRHLLVENVCNYPAPVFVHSQTDKANQLW